MRTRQLDFLLPTEQEIPLTWQEDFELPEVDEDEGNVSDLYFEELNFD